MIDLLVKWPSRSRPDLFHRMFPLWDRPGVRFVVSLDSDDPTLPDYWKYLDGKHNVRVCVGTSANKVEACNRDLEGETFSTIVLASDDMEPQVPDWHERILALMVENFPDGDGVLHLNDGRVGKRLNTLCVCGFAYYRRTGYLYYGLPNHRDGYTSLYCDQEWQDVSEELGRAVYVDDVLIKHRWRDVLPNGGDALHHRNESYYHADAKVFRARKAAGFPVEREGVRANA